MSHDQDQDQDHELEEHRVEAAYSERAAEYTSLLGSVAAMNPLDRTRITSWACAIDGPVLDLGCGPGHWTAHLARHGVPVSGVDLTPEFVRIARDRFPHVTFSIGDASSLDAEDGSLAGVLAWYSLIHTDPRELPRQLSEAARVLEPGGQILIGFFDGNADEAFEHAVTTAYFHSIEQICALLEEAGLEAIDSEQRRAPDARPHASVLAIKR
ncbi:class I SAM-dependent methyltransferase [Leucobacter tenebrionis]|uniref:class I SAM-dependent methyltransferase n=1 Tax=Leucobacter tenebrionis TaxID=2873270 RepID=UPI001CA7A36F|nr:class I SAM-dependent methyltransferase [Leucobacter tenebrionis]QZY52006.1 class I SAM-dependent methyltransferase [Leucobacter tenebrionis]